MTGGNTEKGWGRIGDRRLPASRAIGVRGQAGIEGNFEQLCDNVGLTSDDLTTPAPNDGWTGLAYPFLTGGVPVDAVTFTLNSNLAGGDIWIMGNVPYLLILLAAWGACQ